MWRNVNQLPPNLFISSENSSTMNTQNIKYTPNTQFRFATSWCIFLTQPSSMSHSAPSSSSLKLMFMDINEKCQMCDMYDMYLFTFDMQSIFLIRYHLFLRHIIDSHSKGTLRTDLLWKESWISNFTTNFTGYVSTIKQIISKFGM